MSGGDDVGAPLALLLGLPAPEEHDESQQPPLLMVQSAVNKDYNETVRRWWRLRCNLSCVVRRLQTQLVYQHSVSSTYSAEVVAYNALAQIQTLAVDVERSMRHILRHLYGRASLAKISHNTFIVRWQTLWPYAYAAQEGRAAKEETHCSVSLIFELVCLATLRIACLQHSAVFAEMLWRAGVSNSNTGTPFTLRLAELHASVARQCLANLSTKTLPLYANTPDSTESYLLSTHFQFDYVRNMLCAHSHYLAALRVRIEQNDALRAAALFQSAAQNYNEANQTAFGTAAEHQLMLNRRAAALLALSQHFVHLDAKFIITSDMVTYQSLQNISGGVCNSPGSTLLEAYYCARAAAAIRGGVAVPCEQQCTDIEELLSTKYGITVPQRPAVRDHAEHATVHIVMAPPPQAPAPEPSPRQVLCLHTHALVCVVSIGTIDRVYQLSDSLCKND